MENLKDGLTGLMRVRNEELYVERCIDSCINSLDELIVVYTGCTDNTIEILNRKVKEYPDKLRLFEYNHDVLWYGLNEDEYEYAIKLPDSDPRLYSSLCNFALSKAKFKYAVKIDTDQLYFASEVKMWRDFCALKNGGGISFMNLCKGWIFTQYISLYRRYSSYSGLPKLSLLPDNLVAFFKKAYLEYAGYMLINNKATVAWSGLNVFWDGDWTVPFDGVNIHPPYNGEGDTVIFKISENTYYSKHITNTAKNKGDYAVTEDFNLDVKKIMYAGPVWFHLHANRQHCRGMVKNMKEEHPDLFVPIDEFLNMTYEDVHNKMDHKAHSLFQRTLFALVHKFGGESIRRNVGLLKYQKSNI